MPAFNKRHRETTYAGMRLRPLLGMAGFIGIGMMAFSVVFNNSAYALGSFLFITSIGSLVYAIYELIHDEDRRIRAIKSKAVDHKRKQAML